jgi:hypothetical protein
MAPFYALSGHLTVGLDAGALALNLASLALIAWTLVRRASPGLAIAASTVLVVFVWRTRELLASPWNPHVILLPTIALLVAAAATMAGAVEMLPLAAALASLVAQTHVGVLPSALAVGVAAVAGGAWATRGTMRPFGRAALITVVVLIALWALPLTQQLTGHPGNLQLLWTFFAVESHPGQTLATAVSAWSDMLTGVVRPDFYVAHGWLFRESPVKWAELLVLVEGVALAAAAFVAFRARHTFDLALALLLGGTSLLALWSATHIDGEIFDHEVFWMSGLGALNLSVLLALVTAPIAARLTYRATPFRTSIAGVALFFVGCAAGVQQLSLAVDASRTPTDEAATTKALAADLWTYMQRDGVKRPLVRIDQDTWGIAAGVILQLQKHGTIVAVEDDWLPMFTEDFADDRREDATLFVAGKVQDVRLRDLPGDRVIVSRDPMFVHRLPPVSR